MNNKYSYYLFAFAFAANTILSQTFRVHLDSLTTLDDPELSVLIMKPTPSKSVRLPSIDSEDHRFITVFYSWRMTNDPDIEIMVISKSNGDLLYIDRNLNNDLTDDGEPEYFPYNREMFSFEIVAPSDPKQRVRLLLSRKMIHRKSNDNSLDSTRKKYVDELGNLNPNFAKFIGSVKGYPDFKGSYGSFYFDDRVALRRGILTLSGKHYSLGLFDFSNNGLYNDNDDVIIADVHGNGVLRYTDQTAVFKLNDVFSFAGRNFRVTNVDKYGMWIDLQESMLPTTSFFLQERDSISASRANKVAFKSAVWNIKDVSFEGKEVLLKSYQGKFLLLNFWGEWCKPCLMEIPSLVRAWDQYSTSNVQFISFVKTQNVEKAKELIADSNISWPQILLTAELESKFGIIGYPTNILVFPNGKECLLTHSVNDAFFEMYLH